MKTILFAGIALVLGVVLGFFGGSVGATHSPAAAAAVSAGYNEQMASQMKRFHDSVVAIAPLLQEPQLTDNAWRTNIGLQAATLEDVHEAVARLAPPQDRIDSHVKVLSATGDCDGAMRLLTLAIDTTDAALLPASNALIGRCADKMTALAQ